MNILGWIRVGDHAACGGVVVDGDSTCASHGRPLANDGARIACQKNCRGIASHGQSMLPGGKSQLVHGDKTTGGCPLISTLNDIHGIGNSSGAGPTAFYQTDEGAWVEGKYDDRYVLRGIGSGEPLPNLAYAIERADGSVEHGVTDAQGHTHLLKQTLDAEHVRIYVEDAS
jgi:uncharacterized Zn-binding protein involved in type VI secretion